MVCLEAIPVYESILLFAKASKDDYRQKVGSVLVLLIYKPNKE